MKRDAGSVASTLISKFTESDNTYLIRELGSRYGADAAYEVAKFSGGKDAAAVYTVLRNGSLWSCNCPGFRKHDRRKLHKHIELVKAWLARGKPDPIDTRGFQDWVDSILKMFS